LQERLQKATENIVFSDYNSDGKIDVHDGLIYNPLDINDPYIIVNGYSGVIENLSEPNTVIETVQMVPIHGGALESLNLHGEDSQDFTIDMNGTIRTNESTFVYKKLQYKFHIIGSDSNNVRTQAEVILNVVPNMKIVNYVSVDRRSQSVLKKIVLSPDEKTAYLAYGTSGLVVVDISNAQEAEIIGHFYEVEVDLVDITSVALSKDGKYAYILDAHNEKLLILDVSNAKNIQLVGELSSPEGYFKRVTDIAVDDNRNFVYIVGIRNVFSIVDVTNVNAPFVQYVDDKKRNYTKVTYNPENGLLSLGHWFEVFNVESFNVSDVNNIQWVQHVDVYEDGNLFEYHGKVLFLDKYSIAISDGLKIYRHTLEYPFNDGKWDYNENFLMNFSVLGEPYDITFSKHKKYMYIASGSFGMIIVEIK